MAMQGQWYPHEYYKHGGGLQEDQAQPCLCAPPPHALRLAPPATRCRGLSRSLVATDTTKYFGTELGCQSTYDPVGEKATIQGEHHLPTLQEARSPPPTPRSRRRFMREPEQDSTPAPGNAWCLG